MESENPINSIDNVVMKKLTFVALLVVLVSVTSISSFFAGSYITDSDPDKNIQFGCGFEKR